MSRQKPKQTQWATYIVRWRALHIRCTALDFETSKLASEIRNEFPNGASGDLQCRIWCVRNLDVAASTASMLLRASRVYEMFDGEDWYALGGWQSLQFLSTLRKQGRKKVVRACRKRAEERRSGQIGYTTVRNVTCALGVQQIHPTGRPNRLKVEEDLGFVRTWLKNLYRDYELPKPPQAVQNAMAGTKLSAIAKAAKAG